MLYHREFTISSCHFNGADVYEHYRQLTQFDPNVSAEFRVPRLQMLMSHVLEGIHGHNFKIVIDIEDIFDPKQDYVVDDIVLEKVVMDWHNTNLSVHKDFKDRNLRATTENMAHLLLAKLVSMLKPQLSDDDGFIGPTISVVVHETDAIFASASVDMADTIMHADDDGAEIR